VTESNEVEGLKSEIAALTAELRKHEARDVADEALEQLTRRLKFWAIPLTIATALGLWAWVTAKVESQVAAKAEALMQRAVTAAKEVEVQAAEAERQATRAKVQIAATIRATEQAEMAATEGRTQIEQMRRAGEEQAAAVSAQSGAALRSVAMAKDRADALVQALRETLGPQAAKFEDAYSKGTKEQEREFSVRGKTLVSIFHHPTRRERALAMQQELASAGYSTEVVPSSLMEVGWTQERSKRKEETVRGSADRRDKDVAVEVGRVIHLPESAWQPSEKVPKGAVQVLLF